MSLTRDPTPTCPTLGAQAKVTPFSRFQSSNRHAYDSIFVNQIFAYAKRGSLISPLPSPPVTHCDQIRKEFPSRTSTKSPVADNIARPV